MISKTIGFRGTLFSDKPISEETEETDSRVSAHEGGGRANERDERDKLIAWLIAYLLVQSSWFLIT